jgi:hypothetical protein
MLLTIILVRQVALFAREFREAAVELTSNQFYNGTYGFDDGQGQFYREIRRARRYARPATLLAISATASSQKLSLNRFVKEAQDEIVKRYVDGRVARTLKEELPDCDVIAQRNDHFIILLPEIDRQELDGILNRLHTAAKEKLSLEFIIDSSSFPDEAITFESLLERAENDMENAAESETSMPDVSLADREHLTRQPAPTNQ